METSSIWILYKTANRWLIASIIGSGINGNLQDIVVVGLIPVLLRSLLLLEVELMETCSTSNQHLFFLSKNRFYYWKWN